MMKRVKSLSGAMRISCLRLRTRKYSSTLVGSRARTTERAVPTRPVIRSEYWRVEGSGSGHAVLLELCRLVRGLKKKKGFTSLQT